MSVCKSTVIALTRCTVIIQRRPTVRSFFPYAKCHARWRQRGGLTDEPWGRGGEGEGGREGTAWQKGRMERIQPLRSVVIGWWGCLYPYVVSGIFLEFTTGSSSNADVGTGSSPHVVGVPLFWSLSFYSRGLYIIQASKLRLSELRLS